MQNEDVETIFGASYIVFEPGISYVLIESRCVMKCSSRRDFKSYRFPTLVVLRLYGPNARFQ